MDQEFLDKKNEQLEKEKEELLRELITLKKKPSGKIAYFLLSLGLILLSIALIYSYNIAAFIGIALTFWGALLIYIKPIKFIRKDIFDSVLTEHINSYYKLIEELGYQGTPQHISPSTLWGLNNNILYIPKSDNLPKISNEQLSTNTAILDNPQAIKLTPPGQNFLRLIEDELKIDFSTVDLQYLQINLEKALVERLEVAEAFQMEIIDSIIHIEIGKTIFFEAIKDHVENKNGHYIGDPLISAIACIIAQSTNKAVLIDKIQLEPKDKSIKTDFKLIN